MTGKTLKQTVLFLTKPPEQIASEFALLKTFDEVASLLAVTPYQLFYYTHAGQHYKYLEIKKKHGGVRKIQAPASGLKLVQRKLNQVLRAVYLPKSVAHGFIPGRDVVSNATEHSPARYILNVDLENFFDAITFPRVRGMFMAKPYLRNSDVATTLARLCCFQGRLPQGSPSSPVISNMISARMDSQLKVLARTHKCRYTRYADDLTFSTFVNKFPPSLAEFAVEELGGGLKIGHSLLEIIAGNGFKINPAKSRLQHSSGRQVVTGLTANRFPNVPQEFVRQIRAMLFAWDKFGAVPAAEHFFKSHDFKERHPESSLAAAAVFAKVVKGKIDYLGMVRGHESRAHLSLLEKYASLNPNYEWPAKLPPRELKLSALETAVFAVEGPASQGTAFNLSTFGLLTCAHVVINQSKLFVHQQGHAKQYPVSVFHVDEDRDLALLSFSGSEPPSLPKIEIADLPAKKEDQIILMGYPTTGPSVSSSIDRGAITGTYNRSGQSRHSISCSIFKGNSGGPVLDRNFRLIGIAANGPSKLDPKGSELFGVIPISVLADFLSKAPTA